MRSVKRESSSSSEQEVITSSKREATSSNTEQESSKRAKKTCPPSSYKDFEAQKNGVSLHLVAKDAAGQIVSTTDLTKKEFSTGSYGWSLQDKISADNGEGGTMSVVVNVNCT
jgi:hypothetical protein